MEWREQVARLENEGSFDIAIFVLEQVIKKNPDELDAYIILLFRFIDIAARNPYYWCNVSQDLLREIKEEYYESKIRTDYRSKAQYYFDKSYERFANNPVYLYYTSKIIGLDACFLGLDIEDSFIEEMYQKAKAAGYNNDIEKLDFGQPNDSEAAQRIVNDPSFQEQLATKGAAAEYVIGYSVGRAKRALAKEHQ